MFLAGHLFHILHGVPEEAQEEFDQLFERESVTYEEIPKHLKAYEYTPEEYAEYEREEAEMGPITYVDTDSEGEEGMATTR
ncbi:hypothetical protein BO78DRAFT_394977 [Aspergillus sclerotiicarbonarius CBS 121057]|uniref:Uncharacterized protein n=1 Tax=Aspergillus sclerotiicarbonarius (strain CBS 121057 / IBT 28362) TaxID=1448318 RepID=A0A319EX81_ASPSB|nr:hypothetical protein BO78DRAFT_394977 [Aspergillus sclerotiicarbonarius CBS 121057]